MIALTPDLFARAVIASALSYGDDPVAAVVAASGKTKRSLPPAALGIARATGIPKGRACAILGLRLNTACAARGHDGVTFQRAQDTAYDAARFYLKAREFEATCEPPPPASAPVVRKPAPVVAETTKAQPAPSRAAPAIQRPAPRPATRAVPRGARFENLGGGVSVIRLKPVTDSVARHAKQQIDLGADLEEVADLFGVAADSLKRKLEGAGT